MQREINMYLVDIRNSINSVNEYLGENRDFMKYETNKLLRRAVERELEIIGEAVNRILKHDPNIEISNSKRIVGLRNWIIHSYDNVDNIIIWGIVHKDLPLLEIQVSKLLAELN